jgi:hypothetical protein
MATEPEGLVHFKPQQELQLPQSYDTALLVALSFEVKDDASYAQALAMMRHQAAWEKDVDEFWEKGRKAAHESWKWITGRVAELKKPYAVREILEPKVEAYLKRLDDQRKAAERKALLEEAERRRKADEEAARIQQEADEKARALKRQGDMLAAKTAIAEAKEAASAVVQEAADFVPALVDIAPPVVAGVSGSRPWEGVIDDEMAVIRAVASGATPLMHTMIKGGSAEQLPLLMVNQKLVTYLAKRRAQTNIGIPGCHGERGHSLRISPAAAPAPARSPTGQPKTAPDNGDDWWA